jgi:hypothetical protein
VGSRQSSDIFLIKWELYVNTEIGALKEGLNYRTERVKEERNVE